MSGKIKIIKKTEEQINELAQKLKKGEISKQEIKKMYNLSNIGFESFIYRMTYSYPIYEYSKNNTLYYGLLT